MEKPKQKILAYITRISESKKELLVFVHQQYPEAGIQVPSGTVEKNENLESAFRREVFEESGLKIVNLPQFIGSYSYFRKDIQQLQMRNVFHCQLTQPVADRWSHRVSGKGEDQNLIFEYYWVELDQAATLLEGDQGEYIKHL